MALILNNVLSVSKDELHAKKLLTQVYLEPSQTSTMPSTKPYLRCSTGF